MTAQRGTSVYSGSRTLGNIHSAAIVRNLRILQNVTTLCGKACCCRQGNRI
jgi:hypothetical protein